MKDTITWIHFTIILLFSTFLADVGFLIFEDRVEETTYTQRVTKSIEDSTNIWVPEFGITRRGKLLSTFSEVRFCSENDDVCITLIQSRIYFLKHWYVVVEGGKLHKHAFSQRQSRTIKKHLLEKFKETL